MNPWYPPFWVEQVAKWHVPTGMVDIMHGNDASDTKTLGSENDEDSGVVKDVALTIFPKNKVKGKEAAVWGEMEVLKGLDHENIVCAAQCLLRIPPHTFPRLSSTSGSSQGPSIISRSSLLRADSSLNGSICEESSLRLVRLLSYGKRRIRQCPKSHKRLPNLA